MERSDHAGPLHWSLGEPTPRSGAASKPAPPSRPCPVVLLPAWPGSLSVRETNHKWLPEMAFAQEATGLFNRSLKGHTWTDTPFHPRPPSHHSMEN